MIKIKKIIFLVSTILTSSFSFEYKNIDSFLSLENYPSVSEFEKNYEAYTQTCVDNTGVSSGSIRCLVSQKLWEREAIIYFMKLSQLINEPREYKIFLQSYNAWSESLLKDKELSTLIANKSNNDIGTMYDFMRAEHSNFLITSILKERALFYKNTLETLLQNQ
ncbi:MAG: hypothetical protein PHE60_02420 [Sulfurospirillaceae bacterium]|nr:hypothetical protein [Sulfurospirillaceae bacterium]